MLTAASEALELKPSTGPISDKEINDSNFRMASRGANLALGCARYRSLRLLGTGAQPLCWRIKFLLEQDMPLYGESCRWYCQIINRLCAKILTSRFEPWAVHQHPLLKEHIGRNSIPISKAYDPSCADQLQYKVHLTFISTQKKANYFTSYAWHLIVLLKSHHSAPQTAMANSKSEQPIALFGDLCLPNPTTLKFERSYWRPGAVEVKGSDGQMLLQTVPDLMSAHQKVGEYFTFS